MQLQRRSDLLWEQLGDSVALLDKQEAAAHSLDGAAAAVWLQCDGSCDRGQFVAEVALQGFAVDEIETTIDSLLHLGLLTATGALDRRALLRRGFGAVTVGAVLSIALPEPAAALSTGAPAPQLLNKAGWSLTGTQGGSSEVLTLDSVTYPSGTPDLQYAVVTIPAQPDIQSLTWESTYDGGSGTYVFYQFDVQGTASFTFADPSAELTAWLTATELSAVFYGFEATPQVAGWAYYPNRY